MKKLISSCLLASMVLFSVSSFARGDKKPASPPATVTQKIKSGATLTINYSQPSLKGRTIGTSVEPMMGKVWRMGANDATVFATDKNVMVEGKALKAGKYSIWALWNEKGFNIMFNSAWSIWGTEYEKNKSTDVLTITVPTKDEASSKEMLTYTISKDGKVTLWWGPKSWSFMVK